MGIVIYKDRTGRNSLKRVIAFIGLVIMSAVFCLAAYRGRITDGMFLTYPIGLAVLYAPQLAITLLKIWKGICEPQPPVWQPGKMERPEPWPDPPAAGDKKQDFGGDV